MVTDSCLVQLGRSSLAAAPSQVPLFNRYEALQVDTGQRGQWFIYVGRLSKVRFPYALC